jgi:hypothetical protein
MENRISLFYKNEKLTQKVKYLETKNAQLKKKVDFLLGENEKLIKTPEVISRVKDKNEIEKTLKEILLMLNNLDTEINKTE